MTRKDFELIASAIRTRTPSRVARTNAAMDAGAFQACEDIARRLADTLADTNPRFDKARFLRACGVEASA